MHNATSQRPLRSNRSDVEDYGLECVDSDREDEDVNEEVEVLV